MAAAGIVLCGGRSSRMGRDKAWLPWRGQPIVVHVAGVLRSVVDEVVVVASDSLELPPLDARGVGDREPARGPLAGLRDGLARPLRVPRDRPARPRLAVLCSMAAAIRGDWAVAAISRLNATATRSSRFHQ